MPRIKSAIKRVEISERNRQRNRYWKATIRTARNRMEDALGTGDAKATEEALRSAFSFIDRAVAKGVLHRNTGARRKARLAARLTRKAEA